MLGALLAIIVLVGVVLAARGAGRAGTASSATSVPTARPAATAAIPSIAPPQLATPSNSTPGESDDPFRQLRIALEASRADGRVGQHGDALIAALNSAQQALAAGDKQAAIRQFTAMQQLLLTGTRDGSINAGFTIEAMKHIQSLAASQGLALPLSIQFG
jgi:hypothetical protein